MRRSLSIFACLSAIIVSNVDASAIAATENKLEQNVTTTKTSKKNSRYRILWNAGLGYSSFDSLTDTETIAAGQIGLKGQLNLLPNLSIRSKANFRFESGNSQSLYRELDQNNGLFMREAYLDYKPFKSLRFKAGAISQAHQDAPLLVSRRSFPAALVKTGFQINNFALVFKAQQAIPTSQSFDEERSEMEASPSFTTQTIKAIAGNDRFKVTAYGTNFQYKNLPSKVAFESGLYGNTVPDDIPGNAAFLFEFEGRALGIEGDLRLNNSFTLIGGIQSIENTKAPTGFNQGRLGYIKSEIRIGDDLFIPMYQIFYNESDSSVSYYNSRAYGHNNREGYAIAAEYQFTKSKFKIKTEFGTTDVINARAFEGEEQRLMIRLETFFDDV